MLLGGLFLLGAAGIVFLIHCVRKFNIVAVLSRGNKAASVATPATILSRSSKKTALPCFRTRACS